MVLAGAAVVSLLVLALGMLSLRLHLREGFLLTAWDLCPCGCRWLYASLAVSWANASVTALAAADAIGGVLGSCCVGELGVASGVGPGIKGCARRCDRISDAT